MEIRQAYKRVSKKLHPDKNPLQNAEAMFQQVKVAYDVSDLNVKSGFLLMTIMPRWLLLPVLLHIFSI